MKRVYTFLALLFSMHIVLLADNIVKETGFGEEEITDNISKAQAEKSALDKATIDALERAFGKAIIQGNSTYIENINDGKKVETHSGFNMISNTYVKGEVIEVLNQKCKTVTGMKIIKGEKVEYSVMQC